MAKGINKKNIEKLEAYIVHAERHIRNNRNTGQQPSANQAVWPRRCVGIATGRT